MSLSALLERVEGAMAQDQWQVIRDIALALVPDDPSTRVRVNALCDAGAPVDAALALIGRVLPGWWVQHLGQNLAGWGVRIETQGLSIPLSNRLLIAPTPALALCAALLAAMIGEEAKS